MEGTLYLAPHNLRFTALDLVNVQPSNNVYLARIRRNMTKKNLFKIAIALIVFRAAAGF